MLKYFPVLTDEKVKEWTAAGYMFVFRNMKTIDAGICPTEIIPKDKIEKTYEDLKKYRDNEIAKIVPFKEGYEFLKASDTRYSLRRLSANQEVDDWTLYYNISDDEDEEVRKYRLDDLYESIGNIYKNESVF